MPALIVALIDRKRAVNLNTGGGKTESAAGIIQGIMCTVMSHKLLIVCIVVVRTILFFACFFLFFQLHIYIVGGQTETAAGIIQGIMCTVLSYKLLIVCIVVVHNRTMCIANIQLVIVNVIFNTLR
jgi:hypothetical protein